MTQPAGKYFDLFCDLSAPNDRWDVALIVAEPLAEALQKAGVRCQLTPVS